MEQRGIYYFLFIALVTGTLVTYFQINRGKNMENPQLTDLALEPDILMSTADRNFHEHKDKTAIKYLDDAIATMKILEQDGDSISTKAIEIAIHDLEAVEAHIRAKDIDDDLMYEAFADAMNSLAYASLRISEQFIVEGKSREAHVTINHAMDHLQNSIQFARGEQKADEMRIAGHLQQIIDEHLESDISKIEQVMLEIDSVVQAHVIQ